MTSASTTDIATVESTNSVVTVMTPTEIVSPRVTDLVERYHFFAKASAQNIIQMAITLAEASTSLSKNDLNTFCEAVGVDSRSSTYRKLTHIGLNAPRFEQHLDKLPTAWTTVYNLAKLSDADFEKVVANDNFCPTMTAKSIDAIVAPEKESSKQNKKAKASQPDKPVNPVAPAVTTNDPLTTSRAILINLDGISDSEALDVYNSILFLNLDKRFTFQPNNGLRALLDRYPLSPGSNSMFQIEQAA